MNKRLTLLLLSAICALGCTKGNNSPANTSTTATYQPTTTGSTWTYSNSSNTLATSTITYTINGQTNVFNNISFYQAYSPGYSIAFSHTDHIYYIVDQVLYYGALLQFQYLDDTAAVGATWTSAVYAVGTTNQVQTPSQITGKILEKGITLTVSGQTFKNVIHTEIDFQASSTNQNQNFLNYSRQYYVAQGVGIIETADINNQNQIIGGSQLTGYNIK